MIIKSYICSKCSKEFNDGCHPGYFIVFDKCRGKTCPDCGKVRKLGRVRCLYENFSCPELGEGKNFFECTKCGKMTEYFFNGVCDDCFCEVQKGENSCVCPLVLAVEAGKVYYCSFCEKFHGPDNSIICKECAKNQDAQSVNDQKKEASYKNVLIGLIIILLLGCLFFFVVWKNKQINKGIVKIKK